jgi:hypothetical protein
LARLFWLVASVPRRVGRRGGAALPDLDRPGIGGSALCLDELGLRVSIAGLIQASQPLMELAATVIAARNGSRSSAAKALGPQERPEGGRPRKLVAAG